MNPRCAPWCREHDDGDGDGGTCRAQITTPGGWTVTLNQDQDQPATVWLDDPDGLLHAALTDLDPAGALALSDALRVQARRALRTRRRARAVRRLTLTVARPGHGPTRIGVRV